MQFLKESLIPAPAEEVFAFHERPDAFELLLPPWERHVVLQAPTGLEVGTRVELKTRVGFLWLKVLAEHVAYEPGRSFEDVMLKGPFAVWHHRHLFLEHEGGCLLRDEVEYRPPFGPLGRVLDPILIRPRLQRLFDYRHEVTLREVQSHSR
jgi:ligand-binding SRPBCC domain-containing protein